MDRTEARARARVQREWAFRQQALGEILERNSTLPARVQSVAVVGAANTRPSFLHAVLGPAVGRPGEEATLAESMHALSQAAARLSAFGVFEDVAVAVDRAANGAEHDLAAVLTVREKSRLSARTGVDVGNNEGSSYVNLTLRNALGGAETVEANAVLGTRTRSSYELSLQSPIRANPDVLAQIGGYALNRDHTFYASHEQIVRGGFAKLQFPSRLGRHEVAYQGLWRQLTALQPAASAAMLAEAGDSLKSSISHSLVCDTRDDPLLPTSGSFFQTTAELAGRVLGGDVSYIKLEAEESFALAVYRGVTASAGLRGGVLCSLDVASRFADRFQLGGPAGVRGFHQHGLGPRQGKDSLGGDVFLAGGASLFFPLPRTSPQSPLRLQLFVNGGSLLAMDPPQPAMDTARQLVRRPSVAAGFGLVYRHPVARFELNLCLPLSARANERTQKGLQFGVGLSFL